jgi:hypothetical protein
VLQRRFYDGTYHMQQAVRCALRLVGSVRISQILVHRLGDGENLVGFQAEEAAPHTSSILFGDFPILKACRIEIVKNTGGWGKATTKTTPVRSVRSSIPKPCPSFFLLFPFFEDAPRSSPAKNLKSSTLPSATTMHGCASGEAPEQSMFRGVVPPQ